MRYYWRRERWLRMAGVCPAGAFDKKALSFFDDVKHEWMAEPGKFEAVIGTSSRDIKGIVPFELR